LHSSTGGAHLAPEAFFLFVAAGAASGYSASLSIQPSEERCMPSLAKGNFTVEMKPQGDPDVADGVSLGRLLLQKRFQGELEASSQVEMLTAMTPVQGSAGYVAIERVTGTLHGKPGSFVFQHTGTMSRGAQQLSISVVPDSGTGELTGLSGTFRIEIVEGKHFYEFEYQL
jgi:hypothetical protein